MRALLTMAILGTFLLAGVPVDATPSGLTPVRVRSQAFVYHAPIFIAMDEGYFAAQGIEVRLEEIRELSQVWPALMTGQLDVHFGAANAAFFEAIRKGVKLRIVADAGHATPADTGTAFMVRLDLIDSGRFRVLKDLRGMRIALPSRAGLGEWLLLQILHNRALLTERDVQMHVLPLPLVPDAFRAKTIDAATSRGILVQAMVNPALRLVLAAEEAGISLGDVAFVTGGEPLTPTKQRQFETRGYQVFSAFAFSEFGMAAWACPRGREPDDLHVFTDRLALRQYPRPTDQNGATVPAYLFTSLLPDTRHVMLNVESGDYGGLEARRCGCFLDDVGFHQHMHTIRSFEKLTAEGMTFFGPTLIGLMEEVLPREFGGSQADYQLVEAEDARGQTRLYLLASPRLGELDEVALRGAVLREIRDRHISPGDGRLIHQIWDRADTIQVLRRQPLETETGKIHHLHRDQGALAGEVQGLPSRA